MPDGMFDDVVKCNYVAVKMCVSNTYISSFQLKPTIKYIKSLMTMVYIAEELFLHI